ncbi:MAG: site-specific integrase [Tissierellia bacterium]|nr:site-specific integrase [Tissierellia bacterium]
MGAYRDESKNGTWYCRFSYTNWKGERINKKKRGFATKKEALAWEKDFLNQQAGTLDMTFEEFFEVYKKDRKPRIRLNTWKTKESIIMHKVIPYLGKLKINEITSVTIIQWQNTLMEIEDDHGNKYSPTYLRTIHAQLSSVLNHACRYYNLPNNAARDVGTMGEKEASEMDFWTQAEYEKFIEVIKNKPQSFYAFELLYWCGLRVGELLALTKEKFDFDNKTIRIDQSLQRIDGEIVITAPKTKKSVRTVVMPDFVANELSDYMNSFYKLHATDFIFNFSKSFLHHEMDRGSKLSGVKRIRVHDLRHSHVSLLIELGYSAIAIASRVGHESIDITYRYAHLFPSKQIEMAVSLTDLRAVKQDKWDELLKEDEVDDI